MLDYITQHAVPIIGAIVYLAVATVIAVRYAGTIGHGEAIEFDYKSNWPFND